MIGILDSRKRSKLEKKKDTQQAFMKQFPWIDIQLIKQNIMRKVNEEYRYIS